MTKEVDCGMRMEFQEKGFYVLRGVLPESQVDRLAEPIRGAFRTGDYDGYCRDKAYPDPGVYSMGPRILQTHPEIAEVSLAHPVVVEACDCTYNTGDNSDFFISRCEGALHHK